MENKYIMPQIVDTNVICEAGKTEYATMTSLSAICAEKCQDYIFNLMRTPETRIVLDLGREILGEYENNVLRSGQPTLAHRFMSWLYSYLAKMPYEDLIDIKPKGQNVYEAFPDDRRLDGFDPSDRKFVAISYAHPEHPHIVEGTDCKWWGYKEILHEAGIDIEFLCPEYISDAYQRKMGETHVL